MIFLQKISDLNDKYENTILWQKWKVAYFVSPYFVRGFLFWTILDIWNNKISRRPYFLRGQILYNYR